MQELNVLYEDNHIILVEKIPNVPSQADKTGDPDMLLLVKEYIKKKYHKPGNVYVGLVHRLDRPVGGVMVFAKTSKAASRLSEQVRNKTLKKEYLVVVDGKMKQPKDVLEDYLLKNQRTNMSRVVPPNTSNAKYAKLEYEVLQFDNTKDLSLLKVVLHTGRHHQIRVQLASRDHSIYGDQKYGTRGKEKQIALWAYHLTLQHPITKEEISFKSIPNINDTWDIIESIQDKL